MFNFFKKKESSPKFTDLNFMNERAKTAAILAFAAENADAIFIAWFPVTAEKYRAAFTANRLNESRIIDARQFHSSKAIGHKIIFLQHHPLREKENALLQNAAVEIPVYNSLDEPLFALFNSERIIDVMQKMGMKENEVITHSLISRSITKAQEKIAKKVTTESSAASQKEWLERNGVVQN